jgi:hypothetical protein
MQCQGNAFERNVMHMNAVRRIRAVHFKRDDAPAIIPDELVEKWAPVVRLYVGYLYGHDRQMRRRREGIELRLSAPEEGHPGHVLGATDSKLQSFSVECKMTHAQRQNAAPPF